ncbi:MAG: alpha-1,4-glucan--maltose-1-phosphate maltosyltransferase, partial [Chloroflexi bacterium]|nr:alpha-1,4-glucan--maltose-1-phosphate maltosyltransferase [Chloroflexota bacterium]
GVEEQLNNEKYEFKDRHWEDYEDGGPKAGQSLAPYLTMINDIRRAHPALHWLRNLRFHRADDDSFIVFSKRWKSGDQDDTVIVVANLDPHSFRETWVHLDMPQLGLDWHETFTAHDEITGDSWRWGEHNFVRLGIGIEPLHILHVRDV